MDQCAQRRQVPRSGARAAREVSAAREFALARLAALALRPDGAPLPHAVDQLHLVDGAGARGDRHRDPLSPRQLLLASGATYARLRLPQHALRENLLLDIDLAGAASGTVLRIGPSALVRLMFDCEACGRLDLRQSGLAARIGNERGVLARVLRGGVVKPGDGVDDLGALLPAWPVDWRERVAQVLDAVPQDRVIEYARLAHLAGIQSTYCRAFPRLLAGLGPRYAGKAVTARAPSNAVRWTGAGLFDLTPAQRLLLPSA